MNLDFTFLDEEQVFGNKQLDILKQYGTKCAITDFAILLGGYVSDCCCTSEGNSRKDYTGSWWTKSSVGNNDMVVVDEYGDNDWSVIYERLDGARPVLPYSSISSLCSNKMTNEFGILEVEYGEYPQEIVSEDFARTLERVYSFGAMNQTGKTYTTDIGTRENYGIEFIPKKHIEYEYYGKKYIRIIATQNIGEILSDGSKIEKGKSYWIEVKPIKWLVDEKNNFAVIKNLILSGIQFDNREDYKGDFENTNIKKYLDTYFSKEIIPSNKLTKEKGLSTESQEKLEQIRNPYKFDFDEVSEEEIIKGAIESGIAVFLHGPSSEGKSARVKQIDKDCVIIYLRNATPESLNGKSVYNQETGEMIDVKPTWLKKLEEKCNAEPDKNHIVFFDEISNALPSIQGIAFNIVLDREVNGIWKLPENARIVAAGNDMKDSLAANQIAEPLFNRFAHVYIKTTTESWLKWASENNIHPAIYTYIAYTKGQSLRSEYDGEKPNADPRKWEMASKMLYKTGKPEMLRALVGEEITKEFAAFCNQRVITLEDVLNDRFDEDEIAVLNTSEKYATAMGLSSVDEENFEKVRKFVGNLGKEFTSLFDNLWAKNDESRLEKVAEIKIEEELLEEEAKQEDTINHDSSICDLKDEYCIPLYDPRDYARISEWTKNIEKMREYMSKGGRR